MQGKEQRVVWIKRKSGWQDLQKLGDSRRSALGRGAAAGISYLSKPFCSAPLLRRASVQEEGGQARCS